MGTVRLKNGFKIKNVTKASFSYINSRSAAPSADEFMLTFMVRRSQKERFNFLTIKLINNPRVFTAATDVTDFSRATVQCTGQIIFFILPRRNNVFCWPRSCQLAPILGLRWISTSSSLNTGCSALHCVRVLAITAIFSSLYGAQIRSVGAALRQTRPAEGSQRRIVDACKLQSVISLIFIANNSVLQRER